MNFSAKRQGGSSESDLLSPEEAVRQAPTLHLIIVFWGKAFRTLFLDLTVSSLLAPGNAPAIRNKADSRLLICTSPEDWAALHEDARFLKLAEHVVPQFVDIGDRYWHWKYHKMAHGHRLTTRIAHDAGAVGIHLNPDTLFPDGCLAAAQRLVAEGKDLVLCQAVRFEMEGCMEDVRAGGYMRDDGSIVLPMRDAARIGVRNLHSETRAGNFDSRNFGELHNQHGQTHFPICVYFEVPDEDGIVIFGHNWAPFIMNYAAIGEHDDSSFEHWTIDGSYAFDNFDRNGVGKEVHVVRDSDELFLLGMTPRDEMAVVFDWRWWKGPSFIGRWSKGYLINRVLHVHWMDAFRVQIYPLFARWHGQDVGERWAPVEERARRIVDEYAGKDLHPRHTLAELSEGAASWVKRTGRVAGYVVKRPSEGLRFLWYLLVFRNGVPELRERPDGNGLDWVHPTFWLRVKRGLNRRIGRLWQKL